MSHTRITGLRAIIWSTSVWHWPACSHLLCMGLVTGVLDSLVSPDINRLSMMQNNLCRYFITTVLSRLIRLSRIPVCNRSIIMIVGHQHMCLTMPLGFPVCAVVSCRGCASGPKSELAGKNDMQVEGLRQETFVDTYSCASSSFVLHHT